jgi:preprotein translocase subunit SecF
VFQILREPKFDFMSRRNLLLGVSATLTLAAVIVLAVHGLNLGIEFSGGTELQLKFRDTPDIAAVRSTLQSKGLTSQVVTTIGDPAENEVYIRLGVPEGVDSEDLTADVTDALRGAAAASGKRDHDLNIADESTLALRLGEVPGLSTDEASTLAAAISQRRKDIAIFHTFDELSEVPGMTASVLDHLRGNTTVGPLAVRSQSYIGPAIGKELMQKAGIAILGSLVGMLIYIWIRFQLQWGFAAVVALTHDTLITLGLFSLFGQEMTLPVVAAFLTLVGYSVNDTVVVFDRIRENQQKARGQTFVGVINDSINQTLSRTVITSGLTWIVVFGLYVFGGAALAPFSFVLTVGVIVGTYSSIYVASPFLVLWKQFLERRGGGAAAGAASGGSVKKVSAS